MKRMLTLLKGEMLDLSFCNLRRMVPTRLVASDHGDFVNYDVVDIAPFVRAGLN